MFDRVPMLGQVGITPQAGFGGAPWSVSTPLNPNVRFPAPPGAPISTEENTGRWMCPDGVERVLTAAQAQAMGCTRRNLINMMGQSGTPGSPGSPGGPPVGGGAPTVSVSPIVHNGGFTPQQQVEFFQPYWGYPRYPYPQYPYAYPYPQQQPQQRLVCRKLEEASEKEGTDVFECVYEPVAKPATAVYPVYTYPMGSWNWWF